MEWIVILAVLVGIVVFLRSRNKRQLAELERDRRASDDLARVIGTAEEDVTMYGLALQQLDNDLAGRQLDEATRADYQRALDDYESAKASLAAVQTSAEIHNVSKILDDGRYAIECVRARVAGDPLPQRRPPCFFDPAHGMSVRDVRWTPPNGVGRDVPACALDAERVDAGADPDSRQVMLGSRRLPYWEAGPAYAPWASGYFASFGMMNALFLGTVMGGFLYGDGLGGDGGSDGDSGSDSGGDSEADAGSDYSASGGADSGGWDGGGSGGFDGGGFDGGGFDGGGF
jgi:hypothetical protein